MADPKVDTSKTTIDAYAIDTSIKYEENKKNTDAGIIKDSHIVEGSVGQESLGILDDYTSSLFELDKAKTPFAGYSPPQGINTARTFNKSGMTPACNDSNNIDMYKERIDGKKEELIAAVPGDPHGEEAQKQIGTIKKQANAIQSMLSMMEELNSNLEEVQVRTKELEKA